MSIKIIVSTILFCLFVTTTAYSHPHMAIYASCEFDFEENDPVGLWVNYSFDQYFSIGLISEFDVDGSGEFNAEETDKIYNNAFIYMKNYGFLISIRDKNGRTSPEVVSDFSVSAEDDIITYRFYINLKKREERELYISVYDRTFYCAIYYTEETPVKVHSEQQVKTQYVIEENTEYPVYYNPFALPTDNTTYDRWETGLQTYYPKEIHFVY